MYCGTDSSVRVSVLEKQLSKDFLILIKLSLLCGGQNLVIHICLGRTDERS